MADVSGNNGDAAGPVGKEADRMIRENNHLFTDVQCKVCNAVLISESQKLAHYQSKKHANKVRRYTSIHKEEEFNDGKKLKLDSEQESSHSDDRDRCCAICNMTFSSPIVAQSHYLGKTHAKNMKLKQSNSQVEVLPKLHKNAVTPGLSEDGSDTSDPDKFCNLCHATFNNPSMAKQHYVGKKHRKQETKVKLMAHYGKSKDSPITASEAGWGYPCNTCKIILNSIEQYQAHISGFKHRNQILAENYDSIWESLVMIWKELAKVPFKMERSTIPHGSAS
ncbi:zinc finger protein 346 isoform 4-T7 [Sarcophilus harrisii]